MDRATEIRARALAMANDSGRGPEEVVERARVYEAYLTGKVAATETPLEPGPDGYPDALQG